MSLSVLELALGSVLDGTASSDYFYELALTGCTGMNRAKKTVALLNRLTVKSPLLPYIKDNSDAVKSMLRNKMDRSLLFTAMMCSSYSIFYDTVTLLGKYFHVQDQVSRVFLLQKLSEKYGSNRALDVAFDCIIPMLIEAGVIMRAGLGVYSIVKQEKYSDSAKAIFTKAFLLNNSTLKENDDFESNPFFEYIV